MCSPMFFINSLSKGTSEHKLHSMTWYELTEREKVAILKSLMFVSNANGRINYSSHQYIQTTAIKMDDSDSLTKYRLLIDSAISIPQSEMVTIIANMNADKKDTIAYLWLEAAAKAVGLFGMFCINDFEKEKEVIVTMAGMCNVNINNYLYTKHEIFSL